MKLEAMAQVVRYHSLVVDPHSLPRDLESIAWTPKECDIGVEDIIQGVAHTRRPHFGVQFHPESVATAFGAQLLRNFVVLASATPWVRNAAAREARARTWRPALAAGPSPTPSLSAPPPPPPAARATHVHWRRIPGGAACGGEALFRECVMGGAAPGRGDVDTWWLDSSATASGRARFSFMGARWGPAWQAVTFRLDPPGSGAVEDGTTGLLTTRAADGAVTTVRAGAFEHLECKLRGHECTLCPQGETGEAELPFDFLGGWVGYLGYELRAECLPHTAARRHASPTPDAAMFFVTRFIAADHDTGDAYVVASCDAGNDADATSWVLAMAERMGHVSSAAVSTPAASPPAPAPAVWDGAACDAPAGAFVLRVGREGYKADVRTCMEHIAAGDTYEVCLTTALERPQGGLQPFELYAKLRCGNPAPYAAFMRVGGGATKEDLAVCCSSPERFLRVDKHRRVEAKPIKGTAARVQPHGCPDDVAAGEELRHSVKDRAENLMIVDLLRNDLGRVCCPGTVHVPALCAIESFASVHQLVSTVRGALREGVTTVAAVRACFPGGSMTGAPKLRTCNIIDAIEPRPRGVYSGALGFLSFDGAADLNIVIRTAVLHDVTITVGAGGAVVALSDAEAEYEEMRLKARAVLAAVAAASGTA